MCNCGRDSGIVGACLPTGRLGVGGAAGQRLPLARLPPKRNLQIVPSYFDKCKKSCVGFGDFALRLECEIRISKLPDYRSLFGAKSLPYLTMKGFLIVLLFSVSPAFGASLLIPMDGAQSNHLKAYGVAFLALQQEVTVEWLLNYRGGSFLLAYSATLESECKVRSVSVQRISDADAQLLRAQVERPAVNMNLVRMDKAPRVAVYSPKNALVNDESDAVITVLEYAEIPYTIIYDEEVLKDTLVHFDWLHLHHEDFTGQLSKGMFRQNQVEFKLQEITSARLGYSRVSAMKYDVVKKMIAFCAGGGYLFAMCSGAETFDIALAAEGQDIETEFYHEGVELNYTQALAFENFELKGTNSRSFSDINTGTWGWASDSAGEFFTLFDFSAKWDIVPSLLTQNHKNVIREFSGLTGTFNKELVKPGVLVLGENKQKPNVRYLYNEIGKGHWTYYSGHDPESRNGGRRGQRTDLNLFPHSPGYRLILNNVLFPSASKKKRKT